MKRKPLATAIGLMLAIPLLVSSAHAADEADKSDDQKLEKVVVTGSLIPQAQVETAAPVIQISAADIERQGFKSVYDALRNQPIATGSVQDNQFAGGFTQAANTVSLFGLSPSFTLVLVNGRPMADFPELYNGQSNIVDLSTIPLGIVDHIDIVPGNQSSIYGSSAIAGVINIILKSKVDGYELNVRSGGYSDGGGQSNRLEFTGGNSWGDLNVVYGIQLTDQKPILANQRSYLDSVKDDPQPATRITPRTIVWGILNQSTGRNAYQDPGAAACNANSDLFGGTLQYSFRPGYGNYCGSDYQNSYVGLQNKNRAADGYLSARLPVNDSLQLYADVLYHVSSSRANTGPHFWSPSLTGYLLDNATGNFDLFQKIFSPEESGFDQGDDRFLSHAFTGTLGAHGVIGASDWEYDAYYSRSQYNITDKQLWPLAADMQHFFEQQFLGPQLGDYYGYPIYDIDPAKVQNFFKALTPAQYRSFLGEITTRSVTWTQTANAQVTNTSLLSLPGGDAGFAGVLQAGNQYWNNPVDPRLTNGEFFGRVGTSGTGSRDSYAGAAELRMPVLPMLTADVSGRYDHYKNDGGGSDSKATYKLGLEFRPMDTLLLRGNYATGFRAPDMGQTFAGSSGSFGTATDYYYCAKYEPNVPLDQCTQGSAQEQNFRTGNPNLKSITSKSHGLGVVWSPTARTNFTVDYYKVHIDDEVNDLSTDTVLRTEAACRLGQLDIHSGQCQDAIARVTRAGPNAPVPEALVQIAVAPINISTEDIDGLTASAEYGFDIGRFGSLDLHGSYNVVLDHTAQLYPEDPELDLLHDPFSSAEFKTIFNGSVTWQIGRWTTTLTGIRYGKTPNLAAQNTPDGYAGTNAGTVAPWVIYNGSVTYAAADNATLGLYVSNIKNSRPPKDPTWSPAINGNIGYPYYNYFNYNGFGRSVYLELDVKFGAHSG